VDVCLVGCDRATARGDVCNKIGTYPLALAARDNEIPLYAALPASSVDWEREDATGIPIEERDPSEVTAVDGRTDGGTMARVHLAPAAVPAANYAFDVTPARLVSGLVTEHGVFPASPQGLARLRALAAPGALR
jgi:methylthioribose-1-phosphate isomerase